MHLLNTASEFELELCLLKMRSVTLKRRVLDLVDLCVSRWLSGECISSTPSSLSSERKELRG